MKPLLEIKPQSRTPPSPLFDQAEAQLVDWHEISPKRVPISSSFFCLVETGDRDVRVRDPLAAVLVRKVLPARLAHVLGAVGAVQAPRVDRVHPGGVPDEPSL